MTLVEAQTPMPVDLAGRSDIALSILQQMLTPGTVLAVAADMEKAVLLRDSGGGTAPHREMILDRAIAEKMVQKQWIICQKPGRISRYLLTEKGRAKVEFLQKKSAPSGFAEATSGFHPLANDEALEGEEEVQPRAGETPLALLARRRDKAGRLFLEPALVRAGERLQEDFELTRVAANAAFDWGGFLARGADSTLLQEERALGAAGLRLAMALGDLGPGLGDVCLRCCCYHEGLETAERRLGWSARSGKIVLRIALQRLKRHYDALGRQGELIG